MNATPSGPLVLYFPNMHESLIPSSLPSGVRLLDCGCSVRKGDRYWAPETLPHAPAQVRAMIREYFEFGERFSRPAEMTHFEARGLDDFYTDSRQAIQSELQGKKSEERDPRIPVLQKGQMLLALGDVLEERIAEMQALESRVAQSRADFVRVLGIDPVADAAEAGKVEMLPWERLLEPFLLFLPKNGVLLFCDPVIREGLKDRGVHFSPLSSEESEQIIPGCSNTPGSALARVRYDDILSPEAAGLFGPGEFRIVFWEAGS